MLSAAVWVVVLLAVLAKPLINIPPGMPGSAAAAAAIVNPNYMIGQPPGFQLTAFVSRQDLTA